MLRNKRWFGLKILFILYLCTTASSAFSRAKLDGRVIDATTKLPIVGATISIESEKKGTTTDANGYYSIFLPFGRYNITISSVGYYKKVRAIDLNDDITVNFELKEEIKDFDEVIVKGRREDANVKEVQMGTIKLNMQAIKKIPVAFGETDILKSLTLQAGVSQVGEGAGGLNVRGGRVDQNLVLLDGAPLFNTSHLLGFFSSVNPDVVNDVTLYKGAVPSNYGGRLSAILAMNTRTGNNEKIRYSAGIGTVSGRFLAEGPIIKDKLTFVLGSRVAYPNLLIGYFPGNVSKSRAFFYDLNAKATYNINKKNRISLTGYGSYDDFKFPEDTAYSWNTIQSTLNWNYAINNNLSLNTSAIFSNYTFDVIGLKTGLGFKLRSAIQQKEFKTSLFYSKSEKSKSDFGASFILYNLSPAVQRPTNAESNVISQTLPSEAAREMSLFVNQEYEFLKIFSIQAGLRYTLFQNIGAKTVYQYTPLAQISPENIIDSVRYSAGQVVKTYGGFEPRLSLRVSLGKTASIKLSYNRMRQYLNLISNTAAISPVDFWKLSDTYIPPQVSDQYSVGIFKNFQENAYETSIEVYYKDQKDLLEYRKGARLIKNPILETALLPAIGKNYGIEFTIKKNKGDFTGIASYTYARSLIAVTTPYIIDQINDGEYYPANYDKPHTLNVSFLYNLGQGFNISSNFTYNTGRPITYPDGAYSFNNLPVLNYSKRNLDRIPDFHRLDFSISLDTRKDKDQKRYNLWVLSFYNVYGRQNPYSVYFTSYNRVTRPYQLSVFGSIIPSLTCNINF
jgi:hypothetical protein